MGNSPSTPLLESFLIERLITPEISIGIKSGGMQSLRWRSGFHGLVACQEFEDRVVYQFEDQFFLEFSKGFGGVIYYTLSSPFEKQIGQVPVAITSSYKIIDMNSPELDKVMRLFG